MDLHHPAPVLQLESDDALVCDWLRRFIHEVSADVRQRALLANALTGLETTTAAIRAQNRLAVAWIDAPFAIVAAERGPEASRPVALAGACGLVFLALDIFDDLADGDRQAHWAGWPAGQINLAAATILSALPSLILSRIDAAPEVRAAMQETLARGLLRMSAGQGADLAAVDAADIDPAAVEASVLGKSGEQYATYCALAALLAGAPAERVEHYAEIGRCIGVAGQLASDCHDLLCDPEMRDLANGARTLPIALHLGRLSGEARSQFQDLLRRCRADYDARLRAREALRNSGTVRRVLLRAAVYVERAREAASLACPDPLRRRALDRLLARNIFGGVPDTAQ